MEITVFIAFAYLFSRFCGEMGKGESNRKGLV